MSHAPEPRRPPGGRTPARLSATHRPGGGVRWLTHLDPAEEARYERAVARLVPAIERRLGSEVLANRARGRGSLATTQLEDWGPARDLWARHTRRALARRPSAVTLIADVHACYASIAAEAVARCLAGLGAHPTHVADTLALLHRFEDDGIPGLPIGPDPSGILANAVLSQVDDALRPLGWHQRWVDDVVAVFPDAGSARRGLAILERALAGIGLTIHAEKTVLIPDPAAAADRLLTGSISLARSTGMG